MYMSTHHRYRHTNRQVFVCRLPTLRGTNAGCVESDRVHEQQGTQPHARQSHHRRHVWPLYPFLACHYISRSGSRLICLIRFVNKAGDWKVGGFDLACDVSDPEGPLRAHSDLLPKRYKSPGMTSVSDYCPFVRGCTYIYTQTIHTRTHT